MHKIIISTLLLISFSTAQVSYSFIGTQTSLSNYSSTTAPSIGFKYGIQKDMWRSSINLDYASNGSDTLNSIILQIDKGIFKGATKDSPIKPHAGFSLGVLQHENIVIDKGYGFGLNAGATYLLNDSMDLDLSLKYFSTTKMNNIDSLNTLTFSLHYFY